MRIYLTILSALISFNTLAQQDTTANYVKHATYERHNIIAGISMGFIDAYRHNYSVPAGFQKSNTTGFAPVYFKLEYGLTPSISLAAAFGYDAFLYNFKQNYTGTNGPFTRYETNHTNIFSGGLIGFYHLGKVIPIRHLDPFVGVGLSLNNIRYGALPQGDSTVVKFDHTISPYLKAGARYYISSVFGIYGDVGFDQHAIFSLGFSCRFFQNKK